MKTLPSLLLWIGCLSALATWAATPPTGPWISLFDGHSLNGWRASEHPDTFQVLDGAIVAHGERSHLFYIGLGADRPDYKNFEFEAEVMARAGSNSGIYFHTLFQDSGWPGQGFEVQVNNSQLRHDDYLELKKTGSLYGIRNVHKAVAGDDEWFGVRIRVEANRVQVRINETLLVDYVEPAPGVQGSARRLVRGTFALQGHDPGSEVHFRNLRVRRLPDDLPLSPATDFDEVSRDLLQLSGANFPLVDFHTHLKGGLNVEGVLRHMFDTGINAGIAVNGGIGFSITNDTGIREFRHSLEGIPCYIGLQAEGREWPGLFSAEAIAQFDYVFTDAMTLVDLGGRRTRLWIAEEVDIPDPQAFMDHLVATIERILDTEPIDFYANPTYLPDVLAGQYDALWTPARMDRVIAAAVRNEVGIEINNRYRIPSAAFIRRAKVAGVKFTLGTNNTDPHLGRQEYAIEMIRECGLKWQDMWMPKPKAHSRIRVGAGP